MPEHSFVVPTPRELEPGDPGFLEKQRWVLLGMCTAAVKDFLVAEDTLRTCEWFFLQKGGQTEEHAQAIKTCLEDYSLKWSECAWIEFKWTALMEENVYILGEGSQRSLVSVTSLTQEEVQSNNTHKTEERAAQYGWDVPRSTKVGWALAVQQGRVWARLALMPSPKRTKRNE